MYVTARCAQLQRQREFAVAGIVPELKTVPISETLDAPLVTVWGWPKSLLNHATAVSVGTAIAGGIIIMAI